MLFKVNFVSYTGLYRSIETEKLNLPTDDGRRTILSNHMPIMLALDIGVVEVTNGKNLDHYAISEGMMLFENNEATVLCDEIIDVSDINVEKAQEEIDKAEQKINNSTEEADLERAHIALARALNLMNASKKYGRLHH